MLQKTATGYIKYDSQGKPAMIAETCPESQRATMGNVIALGRVRELAPRNIAELIDLLAGV